MLQEINDKTKKLALEFYNEELFPKILDKMNVLGCIVYGSSTTGELQKSSDIDMLLLVNEADETIRGVKIFKGQKFEYFIKPIEKFLSETIKYTNSNTPSQVAMYQNGYVLVDKYGMISNLLKTSKDYYIQNHKAPKQNVQLELAQISNRISSLENILERNGNEFDYVYYNVLEMIRAFQSKHNGEAQVGFAKAYRVYNDDEYYNKYIGKDAGNNKPDKHFVSLFNKCVQNNSNRLERMLYLQGLYKYVKSKIFDASEEYEIKLH